MENWKKVETNPTWDFEEEKELIGVYQGVETEVGPNKSNLYTFKKSDGEMISVWGNTLLDMRFKNLEKGEEVKIIYLGKTKSEKTGRTYHNFDVYHRKPEFKNVEDNDDIPTVEDEDTL